METRAEPSRSESPFRPDTVEKFRLKRVFGADVGSAPGSAGCVWAAAGAHDAVFTAEPKALANAARATVANLVV
ncbi:hypothetical protein [Nitratireductor sp. GCM10026969]|uniref:hypothetical protein n=1 Tax=Nitratireductor sp. GCM10026969 TaxID=3252645 RepID=UPI00360D67EE